MWRDRYYGILPNQRSSSYFGKCCVGHGQAMGAKWNSKATPYIHFTEKDPEWASKFHIWRMDWDEEVIKLYLDDELLNEIPLKDTVNGSIGKRTNPFTKPQYLLLNLAIGGINGGPIDESALPMKYEIDYVRVYQKEKKLFLVRFGEIRREM